MQSFLPGLPFLGLVLLVFDPTSAQQLSRPFSAQDAVDTVAIQQVINLYAITVDQHKFDLLPQIFTSDAIVNFNTPGVPVLRGINAITEFISTALHNVVSYHAQSTHNVGIVNTAKASATTYNTATFFTGEQQVSRWGRYVEYF